MGVDQPVSYLYIDVETAKGVHLSELQRHLNTQLEVVGIRPSSVSVASAEREGDVV